MFASNYRIPMTVFGCTLAAVAHGGTFTAVNPGGTLIPGQGNVVHSINNIYPLEAVTPARVWGKEYVNNLNVDDTLGGDPEQILAWNGSGQVKDGRDYSPLGGQFPQRPYSSGTEDEIDALANSRDALYAPLLQDSTAMVFSIDDAAYGWDGTGTWTGIQLPASGPLNVGGGQLAGAGELTRSTYGSLALSPWALQANVDGRTFAPRDISGLDLWGPKPTFDSPATSGDADKYSLAHDAWSGVSVWNANGTPYLWHAAVVAAVTSPAMLGPIPPTAVGATAGMDNSFLIDVDATIIRDGHGSTNSFDLCTGSNCIWDMSRGVDQEGKPLVDGPFGLGLVPDSIVFSIKQIPLATGGYYATGSELFVLNQFGGVSFLNQGGHTWDPAFAQSFLGLTLYNGANVSVEWAVPDINALEVLGDIYVTDTPPVLMGDYNGNGTVDLGDYALWRDNLGGTGTDLPGDGNLDGVVDRSDYDIWVANFGSTWAAVGGAAMASAVPEPATAGLAAAALVGAVLVRRRG